MVGTESSWTMFPGKGGTAPDRACRQTYTEQITAFKVPYHTRGEEHARAARDQTPRLRQSSRTRPMSASDRVLLSSWGNDSLAARASASCSRIRSSGGSCRGDLTPRRTWCSNTPRNMTPRNITHRDGGTPATPELSSSPNSSSGRFLTPRRAPQSTTGSSAGVSTTSYSVRAALRDANRTSQGLWRDLPRYGPGGQLESTGAEIKHPLASPRCGSSVETASTGQETPFVDTSSSAARRLSPSSWAWNVACADDMPHAGQRPTEQASVIDCRMENVRHRQHTEDRRSYIKGMDGSAACTTIFPERDAQAERRHAAPQPHATSLVWATRCDKDSYGPKDHPDYTEELRATLQHLSTSNGGWLSGSFGMDDRSKSPTKLHSSSRNSSPSKAKRDLSPRARKWHAVEANVLRQCGVRPAWQH
eukprot:TRINITY_DN31787_c3_g1_i1.p1 TRINITY_DN31787_c3_g1~~TRINITY_DN31787_c3_g1_i1.p1  ORF type:complete len:442 (+),score=36.84 TRINITY_DN31787_c3_g1_i1:70-1326(+)